MTTTITTIAEYYEAERDDAIRTAQTTHRGRYFRSAWWRDANTLQDIATHERWLNCQAKN